MPSISTGGWDTVFALSLTEVNRHFEESIAQGTLRIPDLNWTSEDEAAAVRSVQFEPWQLSGDGMQGAGGTLISVRFPIRSGTARFLEERGDLAGVVVTAQVSLVAVATAKRSVLKLGLQHGVKVTSIAPGKVTGTLATQLDQIFTYALSSAAMASFDAVFASVDFNVLAGASADWLAPKAVGYAFLGGRDDASSYLGVLCMTDNFVKGNPTPPASLSRDLISEDSTATFAMARSLFFRNLLLKGINDGIGGEKGAFQLSADGRKIIKRPGTPPIRIQTQSVDLSVLYSVLGSLFAFPPAWEVAAAGLLYTLGSSLISGGSPKISGSATLYIESLDIVEAARGIQFTAGIRCDIETCLPLPVVQIATSRLTSTSTVGIAVDTSGVARLTKVGESAISTPTVEAPEWMKASSVGMNAVLTIIMSLAAAVTGGGAAALMMVELVALKTAMKFLPEAIRMQIQSGLAEGVPAGLEAMAIAAAAPLSWSDRHFIAKHATLSGDLAFAGEFVETPKMSDPDKMRRKIQESIKDPPTEKYERLP